MSKPEGEPIYSVSWRLRRTTVEYAYVSVPNAGDMVRPDVQGVNASTQRRWCGEPSIWGKVPKSSGIGKNNGSTCTRSIRPRTRMNERTASRKYNRRDAGF
jgi:hypothetical protein